VRRLRGVDLLLLLTLVPLFLVVLALHLIDGVERQRADLPIYATVPWGGGDYPIVAGYKLEAERRGSGLEVGDRLLAVDDVDLRGRGYVGFAAVVLAEAGADRTVEIVYQRDGETRRTQLEILPLEHPLARVPGIGLAAIAAVLVLLYSREVVKRRLFFGAFMAFAIFELPFYGPAPAQTYVSNAIFMIGGTIAFPLMWIMVRRFPGVGAATLVRPSWWEWSIGPLWLLPRLVYLFGSPLPMSATVAFAAAVDAVWVSGIIWLLAAGYRRADALDRRRLRWILLGTTLGLVPITLAQLALVLDPGGVWLGLRDAGFALRYVVFGLAPAFIPIAVLISIVRYNLFDVDRLLSATVAFALLLSAAVVGLMTLVPVASEAIARGMSWDVATVRLALAVPVVLVLVPATRRLYPHIDALLFPAQAACQRGVTQLLADLSGLGSEDELATLLGRRVAVLFEPRSCVLFVGGDGDFRAAFIDGDAPAPSWAPRHRLARLLEVREEPWHLRGRRRREALESLGDVDGPLLGTFLDAIDAVVLVPLRRGPRLAALLCLGPRRSGDVYTRTDLQLLTTIGHQASGELLRLEQRAKMGELQEQKQRADEANRAKSQLLAGASHDLRQPVHALGLLVGMLEDESASPRSRELVQRIQASVDALEDMFNAVLEVSKLDAGVIEPAVRDFPIGPMLERIGVELSAQAHVAGLELRVVPTRLSVRSDPVLLARIVRNLVTNALRYTEKGRVVLGCRRAGSEVVLQVWDTGAGIPEERQREIFEAYRQLTEGGGGGGLGLGLSIVERLAVLLGHAIELRSTPGKGSVFGVRVPRGEQVEAAASRPAAGPDFEGRRILVVDDDATIRDAATALLEHWGCEARAVAGCAELDLLLAEGWRPELVIADYQLAGTETGIEAIDRVRAVVDSVKSVVISGDSGPGVAEKVAERGLPLVSKPLSAPRLRMLLARTLPG
jgi:signal transduction histidine kinase/CheY-like chemotaxis protein